MSALAVYLVAGAFAASLLLTGWIRRYALAHDVLDVPNERSLHSRPTPRGGGLSIVLVAIVCFAGLWIAGAPTSTVMVLLGGVPVAIIGWVDDHRRTSAWARLLVHCASALWAVIWMHGFTSMDVGAAVLRMGIIGPVAALIGIVWCVNLYNFMDGIDGIAGGEAVVVAGFGAVLLAIGGNTWLATAAGVLCAASAGFLPWNWQSARIFMGDVGSGFLGYEFAVLALLSEKITAVPLLLWGLLAALFLVDATLTLLRRVARGERWYEAHKSHAYQRLVQSGWSHARTSSAVMGMGVVLGVLAVLGLLDRSRLLVYWAFGMAITIVLYYVVERREPMRGRGAAAGVQSSIHSQS